MAPRNGSVEATRLEVSADQLIDDPEAMGSKSTRVPCERVISSDRAFAVERRGGAMAVTVGKFSIMVSQEVHASTSFQRARDSTRSTGSCSRG